MEFFFKGLIIGIVIALPFGPIGMLCIQRTMVYGRGSGLATGLGATTADTFYGAVAAYGVTLVSDFLMGRQFWIRIVGGMVLLYLGLKTFFSKPAVKAAPSPHSGLLTNYLSSLFLTLASPATILSFIAVFAAFGPAGVKGNWIPAALMVGGISLGSVTWWMILSNLIHSLRSRLNLAAFRVINKVTGSILFLFAVFVFLSLVKVS